MAPRRDYYEAASPLGGPTRYRVIERVERRHRWHEPEHRRERERFEGWPPELVREYLLHPTYIDWSEVGRLNEEERAKLLPYLFSRRLGGDVLERLPRLDLDELEAQARTEEKGELLERSPRWRSLPKERDELVPWAELPAEERARQRLLEYECPWPEYEVTVPALPGASDLTAAQRELVEELELEGDASGLERLAAEGAGGWHVAWREPTGFPPGRPPVPADELEDIKAGLLEAVGLVEDVRASVGRGRRPSPELDRRVALVLHDGRRRGTLKALEELYGLPRSTILRMARRGGLNATLTLKGEGLEP